MTATIEAPAIEIARVFHGAEGSTVFVTPFVEGGYSFRNAAKFWKAPAPTLEHREGGDIVTFPKNLSEFEVRKIADIARVGELVHYPGMIKNFEEQLERARLTLGPIRPAD